MQLSHTPVSRGTTPTARPPAGRAPAGPWPFYVQVPRPPCSDIALNTRRVLEISARYFSAPPAAEPVAAARR